MTKSLFWTKGAPWLGLGLAIMGYLACERAVCRHEGVGQWLPTVQWNAKRLPVVASQAFGWRSLVADGLWVRAIQYLGESGHAQARYPEFYPMVKEVVETDPYCVSAYAGGSAVLMWVVKDPLLAMELLKAGIYHNPTYGRFQLYLAAFTYYQSEYFERTIGVLETLFQDEDHPVMLEPILGNLYVKVKLGEKARQLWWWIWYHSRSEDNRAYAKDHLQQSGDWK